MTFDASGVCSHCLHYEAIVRQRGGTRDDASRLVSLLTSIRDEGKGRAYDCIVGVSGGIDSSYVLYLARQQGLRALAVHLDNGWNSELAVSNIENLVRKLGVDLYTHVISWSEFRDLQVAYLRASVVDIEAVTDHAILACLYAAADRHRVRHILTGISFATEGLLPSHWVHNKNDLMNIRAIHRAYARTPLKTFPTLGLLKLGFFTHVKRIRMTPFLDYVPYVKQNAKDLLAHELGWRDYGGKHYESVFTRFYQAYILPRKFGIDKRRSHLSTLICARQLTREQALCELKQEPYDPQGLAVEREFVIKKLGLTETEFELFMRQTPRSHLEFASHLKIRRAFRPLRTLYRKLRARAA